MTSSPFRPSTIERRVRAATTPCRPGTYPLATRAESSHSGGELAESDRERPSARCGIVERRVLAWRVRATGRSHEDHPGRHARKLRVLRVVAGPAYEQVGINPYV